MKTKQVVIFYSVFMNIKNFILLMRNLIQITSTLILKYDQFEATGCEYFTLDEAQQETGIFPIISIHVFCAFPFIYPHIAIALATNGEAHLFPGTSPPLPGQLKKQTRPRAAGIPADEWRSVCMLIAVLSCYFV